MHEEYIHVIDLAIEASLQSAFSDQEISQFYADFKADFKTYKTKNPDAYEILLSSIDFVKFKEQMLKFSKGSVDVEQEDIEPAVGKLGEDLFWDFYREDLKDPKNQWRKALNLDFAKHGFSGVVHQKPSPFPGTAVDLLRMDLRFKNVSKQDWFDSLKDGPPMKNVKESTIIEQLSETEHIMYMRIAMPVMNDREIVMRSKMLDLNDKESLMVLQSVKHKAKPIQKSIVRAQMFKLQMVRQDEENPADLLVTDITNFDMQGYFPSRLMNMVMANVISKGVVDISNQVRLIQQRKKESN